jgi:hypothetical protein
MGSIDGVPACVCRTEVRRGEDGWLIVASVADIAKAKTTVSIDRKTTTSQSRTMADLRSEFQARRAAVLTMLRNREAEALAEMDAVLTDLEAMNEADIVEE